MTRPGVQAPQPSPKGAYIRSAQAAISVERLGEYKRNDSETAMDRLGHYAWNVALCEALYPVLHLLEVALRNSLHEAIRRSHPVPQYLRRSSMSWVDADTLVLTPEHAARVAAVKGDLAARLRGTSKPLTAGRLIAELNFGFWTYLFDSAYGFVSPAQPRLWPRLLADVFPAAPAGTSLTRATIETRLKNIRMLRNRAFHHEPIWNDPDLEAKYDDAVELVRWISPATAETVLELDRFADVYNDGADRFLRRRIHQIAVAGPY